MTTLSEILEQGTALVLLDADTDPEGKLPTGMAIRLHRETYDVFFEVNGSGDFEHVNSYPITDYVEPKKLDPYDLEEVLMGAAKLAENINNSEVDL